MLLSGRNVSYRIDQTAILSGVDFALRSGELVGLIGANGAGKSTLLKIMGGLWKKTHGDLSLLDRPIETYTTREIAQIIAHVPQITPADFAFTARDMVLMGRSPHVSRFAMESAADRTIADRAMRKTNTQHLSDRLITTLSGGERQRVIIARALAQTPRLLLLDEPTNNLDLRHAWDVLTLARQLAHEEGLGVIAALHDLGQAARFCDRLIMIWRGQIIANGAPEAVLTPENLHQVFEIDARLYREPHTNALAIAVIDR